MIGILSTKKFAYAYFFSSMLTNLKADDT